MKPLHRILVTIGVGIVLVIGFYMITNAITKYTGFFISDSNAKSDFEVCLSEQDITLYINTNNIANTLNNIQLKDYLSQIKIMNCMRNNQVCIQQGVDSFPTWVINSNKINEDIGLEQLKEFSGCNLIR